MKQEKIIPKYKQNRLQIRKNWKLFKILNDEIFRIKLLKVSLNQDRVRGLGQNRIWYTVPSKTILKNFIEEDYKFITGDTRGTREIMLDLLSEENEYEEE